MPFITSTILKYFKDRWILWATVAAFIVYKIPHLYYPFYWDESWSYEPAIRLMYEHGPSLMPNAIDTDYSRGHPLLFYFCASAWMKIFGPSAFSQHAFALFLFVLLIIGAYEVCRYLFNKRTALLTLAIFPLQVIFFVQSTMLLPEIMVALLSLLSIYFYCTRRHILTFITLLALLLTKESGMVTGLLLGADATIKLFNRRTSVKERLVNFLPVLFAGVGIASFFVGQRLLNGWYFFPQHLGLVSFKWDRAWGEIKCMLGILFTDDARLRLFQIVMFFALILSINTRKIKYLLPVLIAFLVYISINEVYDDIVPRQAVTVVLALTILAMTKQLWSFTNKEQQEGRLFIQLALWFIVLYMSFCATNFYTDRYTIPALAVLLVLTAYYLDRLIAMFYDPIYLIVALIIILTGQYAINNDKGFGDIDMAAFGGMKVEQDIVKYMQDNKQYKSYIAASSYQDFVHLTDPRTGFMEQKEFEHVTQRVTDTTQLVIFNNIEPSDIYNGIKEKGKLVYRTEHNGLWGEIYRLK
ncbi:MAG: glycosyltransferase family 39 protein [Flavipsychrobacter sp.]|nr:glycosyltransferase family 39 protein [Flavipsychrobacter sp.]